MKKIDKITLVHPGTVSQKTGLTQCANHVAATWQPRGIYVVGCDHVAATYDHVVPRGKYVVFTTWTVPRGYHVVCTWSSPRGKHTCESTWYICGSYHVVPRGQYHMDTTWFLRGRRHVATIFIKRHYILKILRIC